MGTVLAVLVAVIGITNIAHAQSQPVNDFGLEVSPSPLVNTIKPGVKTKIDLKIRNNGVGTENLVISPRQFNVDKNTGQVTLGTDKPAEIADWLRFSSPRFTVEPNKVFTQTITVDLPKESGFSYSFALVISRQDQSPQIKSGATLQGSVAVFTLLNVDRPGATRKFEVTDFKPTVPIFEYLPADFNVTFMNTGNTIVQPKGNVFIQRGSDDKEPISTLPVNDQRGYLLPDRPRILTTTWDKGFPVYKTVKVGDEDKKDLIWDWSKLTDFRFGMYTAKLVAVYNDGQRDVPVEREVVFWVIPWRALLILIALIAVVLFLLRKVLHRRAHYAVTKAMAEQEKSQQAKKKRTRKKKTTNE